MFRSQIHFILIAPWITFLNISFCCHHYYMASTVTSEMDRISHCDWQLELTRRRYLARCVSKENGVLSYIITILLTKLIWSRWWSFTCVWTSTSSWHINKQKKKKNLANIPPCWPRVWLLTHRYLTRVSSSNSHCMHSPEYPCWGHFTTTTMHSSQCQYQWRQVCYAV